MHLNHAEISGVQLSGTFPPQVGVLMTAVVDVYNPNSYDVAVRAMRGQVVFAERFPLPITFQAPGDGMWLPAGQTTQVRFPMQLPGQLALALLQQAFATTQIPYRLTGKADVTGTRTFKIESDDYSVDEQGFVDRSQIEAAVRGIFQPGFQPGAR